jgi:hypothetical protein
MQTVQFGILAALVGIGAGVDVALVGQGIHSLASFVGDLVPGQLGITEGAFRLSADVVGGGAAAAITVPVLLHVIVIAWIIVGALLPLFWQPPGPPSGPRDDRHEEPATTGLASVPPPA